MKKFMIATTALFACASGASSTVPQSEYDPESWAVTCGDTKLTVVYGKLDDGAHDLAVIRVTKPRGDAFAGASDRVRTETFSEEFRPYLDRFDFSKLTLACAAGAPVIVAPQSVLEQPRQLILTTSGRIIENTDVPLLP